VGVTALAQKVFLRKKFLYWKFLLPLQNVIRTTKPFK